MYREGAQHRDPLVRATWLPARPYPWTEYPDSLTTAETRTEPQLRPRCISRDATLAFRRIASSDASPAEASAATARGSLNLPRA